MCLMSACFLIAWKSEWKHLLEIDDSKKGESYNNVGFVEKKEITEMFDSKPVKFLSILVIEILEFSFEELKSVFFLEYIYFAII